METSALAALFVAAFVNAALPGPCVILTFGRTARSGVGAGLVVTSGILAGDALLVSAAVGATLGVLALAPAAFPTLKWFGIACLVLLAARSLLAAARPQQQGTRPPTQDALAGALVGLSSPYNLVFYLAIFPQVLPSLAADAGAALAVWLTAMGGIAAAQLAVVAVAAGCNGLAGRRGGRAIDYATAAALLVVAGTAAATMPATVKPASVQAATAEPGAALASVSAR